MAGRGTDIVLGGNIEKDVQAIEADESMPEADRQAKVAALREHWKQTHEQVKANGGLRSSSPPSATSHAASTTSCAAVRAVKVTPALRVFT